MPTLRSFLPRDRHPSPVMAQTRARRRSTLAAEVTRPLLEWMEPRLLLSSGPVVIGDVAGADAQSLAFAQSATMNQGATEVTLHMTGGAADVAWGSDVEWTVTNGKAVVSAPDPEITNVNLHDTTASSSLAVNVLDAAAPFQFSPYVRTSMGSITGTGVDKILAPQVTIAGTGIDVTGAVSYCSLGDVAPSAILVFGGTSGDTMTFTAGNVASPELTYPGTIRRLTVESWTTPADITAQAIIRINCKTGDFAANLVATTGDIGSAMIYGSLTGDVTAQQGNIGAVRVYGGWGSASFSNITADGQIGIIDVYGGPLQGSVQANAIGLVSASGILGTIESDTSIGSIRGGLMGTAQAGTSIGSFFGSLDGTLDAGDSIGGIWLRGGGNASLVAHDSIGSILVGPALIGIRQVQFQHPPAEMSIGTYTLEIPEYSAEPAVLTIDLGSGTPVNTGATLGSIHAVGVDLVVQGLVPFDPETELPTIESEEFHYISGWEMSDSGYPVVRESVIGGNVFIDLDQIL